MDWCQCIKHADMKRKPNKPIPANSRSRYRGRKTNQVRYRHEYRNLWNSRILIDNVMDWYATRWPGYFGLLKAVPCRYYISFLTASGFVSDRLILYVLPHKRRGNYIFKSTLWSSYANGLNVVGLIIQRFWNTAPESRACWNEFWIVSALQLNKKIGKLYCIMQ